MCSVYYEAKSLWTSAGQVSIPVTFLFQLFSWSLKSLSSEFLLDEKKWSTKSNNESAIGPIGFSFSHTMHDPMDCLLMVTIKYDQHTECSRNVWRSEHWARMSQSARMDTADKSILRHKSKRSVRKLASLQNGVTVLPMYSFCSCWFLYGTFGILRSHLRNPNLEPSGSISHIPVLVKYVRASSL